MLCEVRLVISARPPLVLFPVVDLFSDHRDGGGTWRKVTSQHTGECSASMLPVIGVCTRDDLCRVESTRTRSASERSAHWQVAMSRETPVLRPVTRPL
jgi:hypothetical protein